MLCFVFCAFRKPRAKKVKTPAVVEDQEPATTAPTGSETLNPSAVGAITAATIIPPGPSAAAGAPPAEILTAPTTELFGTIDFSDM